MNDTWKQTNEQPAAFNAIPPREMADVRGGDDILSGETYRKRPEHDTHIELIHWSFPRE